MNRLSPAAIAIGCLGLAGCSHLAQRPTPPPPPTVESRARDQRDFESRFRPFLPKVGAVHEATLFQIDRERGSIDTGFHGYTVRKQEDLPLSTAEELLSLLNAPRTYSPEGAGCYTPALALRYAGTLGAFDLVVCLDCQYVDLQPDPELNLRPLSDSGAQKLRQVLAPFLEAPPSQPSTAANPSLQRTTPGRSPGCGR